MNPGLTISFLTARNDPKSNWFFDSLRNQVTDFVPSVIVVDSFYSTTRTLPHGGGYINHVVNTLPKPTIWQGLHRITSCDWWAKSNAHNTAIILCETDWIAFVDDRCVLTPDWLQCIHDAMAGNYAVCGSYEKRSGLKVENGVITDMGENLGVDTRPQHGEPIPTTDWYGGSCALPLEWCLAVNGYSEDLCDSLGSEDSMFGRCLVNSGFPIKYDNRMRIIEDRNPYEIDGALKRADKNPHLGRQAKSWGIVKAFYQKTSSQNSYDIRQHRARVQNGEDLNSIMPSASHYDWYDNQPVSEME